jgi:benzoate 4-monooxygenase
VSLTTEITYIPAIRTLNDRDNFSASMGVLPPWFRSWVLLLLWFRSGKATVQSLAGMANAGVERQSREGMPEEDGGKEDEEGRVRVKRTDLLERLMAEKDAFGEPMGRDELTAEALTLMIAGTDTTSK